MAAERVWLYGSATINSNGAGANQFTPTPSHGGVRAQTGIQLLSPHLTRRQLFNFPNLDITKKIHNPSPLQPLEA